MKKIITTLALGSLLVLGLTFAQESQSTETAFEVEPSILSIEKPTLFF